MPECPNCEAPFEPRSISQVYCSPRCQVDWNRQLAKQLLKEARRARTARQLEAVAGFNTMIEELRKSKLREK